ncbi:MAG: hypothetical protein V3W37_07935 [Candidatus Binatia bacterium]
MSTDSTNVTLRVRIVQASGTFLSDIYHGSEGVALRDPHPEHIGKEGRIVAWAEGASPLIRLDDGTELWGSECWWEPIKADIT